MLQLHTGDDGPHAAERRVRGSPTDSAPRTRTCPGFVTICPTRGHGGAQNYGNAFLPAAYQGTAIGTAGTPASERADPPHRQPANSRPNSSAQQLDFMQALNQAIAAQRPGRRPPRRRDRLVTNWPSACRPPCPRSLDLARRDEGDAQALRHRREADRRLRPAVPAGPPVRRGRRALHPGATHNSFKWDQHGNLKQHETNAREVDKPIAGLLTDLKQRGLLKDTLVLWGGEFGRTPVTPGQGRPRPQPAGLHDVAGRRRREGRASSTARPTSSATTPSKDKVHMHDLHATILHLLGLDHEKLTFRYAGRDFRLTDVYGRVVKELFA